MSHPRWGKQTDAEFMASRRFALPDGCWLWLGWINKRTGYGQTNRVVDGVLRRIYAHRLAWIAAYGEIPDGMTVDHTCHKRACVNPSHLRLLTLSEHGRIDANYRWHGKEGI